MNNIWCFLLALGCAISLIVVAVTADPVPGKEIRTSQGYHVRLWPNGKVAVDAVPSNDHVRYFTKDDLLKMLKLYEGP